MLWGGNWIFIVSSLYKAIMYTQVKLPPLIPPMLWGETEKSSPLPFARGGLGWGNLRNNGDSITCDENYKIIR
jgi:hypothetical protein